MTHVPDVRPRYFTRFFGITYASAGCLPDHDGYLATCETYEEALAQVEEFRNSGDWEPVSEHDLYDFSITEVWEEA